MKETQTLLDFIHTPEGRTAILSLTVFAVGAGLLVIFGNAFLDNKKFTIWDALGHSMLCTFASVMSIMILLTFHLLTWVLIVPPFVAVFSRPLWIYAKKHEGAIIAAIAQKALRIYKAAFTKSESV